MKKDGWEGGGGGGGGGGKGSMYSPEIYYDQASMLMNQKRWFSKNLDSACNVQEVTKNPDKLKACHNLNASYS